MILSGRWRHRGRAGSERPGDAPGHFAQVVRWDARGHADGDALRAVDEQVR
jgi:hypothetical protein